MQLEGSCVRLFLFSFGFRISFSELVFVCRYGDSFSGSLGIRYGHLLQRKKVASALKLLMFSAEEPSIIDLRPYGDAERENNMNETYITTELLAQYAQAVRRRKKQRHHRKIHPRCPYFFKIRRITSAHERSDNCI